jgi:hypothetical protein
MSSDRGGSGCLAFLAAIVAGLFVGSTLVVLLLFNVERGFLQPGLYKDAMVQQRIYDRVPELAAEQLVYSSTVVPSGEEDEAASDQTFIAKVVGLAPADLTGCLQSGLGPVAYAELGADSRQPTPAETDQVKACLRAHGVPAGLADTHDGMPVFFWILTEEDWQTIFDALLPPDWLRAQFESVIDQVYEDLRSDEPGAAADIPLADLKARLLGDEGFDAIVTLLQAQPACTPDQMAQIQGLTDPTEPLKDVPVCRPPDPILTAMYPNIQATLALLDEQIPDQAELRYGSGSEGSENPLERPHQILNTIRSAVLVSLLVPLVLLGLVTLLVVRSVKGLLRWWGIPVLASGVIGAALALASLASTHRLVGDLIVRQKAASSSLAPGVLDAEADLLNAIAQGYLEAVLIQAIALAVLGAVMVTASFYVGRPAAALPVAPPPGTPPPAPPPMGQPPVSEPPVSEPPTALPPV